MREIKFRVRGLGLEAEGFVGYEKLEDGRWRFAWDYGRGALHWYMGIFKINGAIREQYTGLNDKNKVEIYAGDIVEHEYYGKCEVVWSGGWSIKHISGGEMRQKQQRFPQTDESFKILGNIYNNPELIK